VLAPNNFFDLHQSYEIGFDELGLHSKDGFFVVNMYRLMLFEPYNLFINQDIGSTGATFVPYRFPQIFRTTTLERPENVVGK